MVSGLSTHTTGPSRAFLSAHPLSSSPILRQGGHSWPCRSAPPLPALWQGAEKGSADSPTLLHKRGWTQRELTHLRILVLLVIYDGLVRGLDLQEAERAAEDSRSVDEKVVQAFA